MLEEIILIVAGFAAGLLSGTVGFGGSMILLPAMTSCYGIEIAVPMSTVSQLLSNLFRMGAGFRSIRWRKAGFFLILALPLTIAGAYGFVVVPKALMTKILCLLLIVFAFLEMTEKFRLPRSRWTMLAGGGIAGGINGLLHEVRFQSAAYASVLQCHETVVLASHDTAFLDELGIDVDFSYVIDNYGKPYSFPV